MEDGEDGEDVEDVEDVEDMEDGEDGEDGEDLIQSLALAATVGTRTALGVLFASIGGCLKLAALSTQPQRVVTAFKPYRVIKGAGCDHVASQRGTL